MDKPLIARKRGCEFDVVSDGNELPSGLINAPFTPGIEQGCIRYAGGCRGISDEVMAAMPAFFLQSHRGFKGVAFSGGTLSVEDIVDQAQGRTTRNPSGFTITYVPALLAANYPCLAVSTTPRTDQMSLDEDFGGLILTDSMDRAHFGQHRVVIVQKDAAAITEADWSKDVLPYLNLMQQWQKQGVKVAIVACNGGGVTKKEIYWALEREIPVIAIEGSGRETDAFITAFRKGEAQVPDARGDSTPVDPALVSIVSFADPNAFRQILVSRGLITDVA